MRGKGRGVARIERTTIEQVAPADCATDRILRDAFWMAPARGRGHAQVIALSSFRGARAARDATAR